MKYIKIEPFENGAHDNQENGFSSVPSGWAVIPDSMTTENFPFGTLEAEYIDGVMTVTAWTPGTIPEPEPEPEPEPTQLDRVEAQATYTAMMTDTLLESEE